MRASWVMRQSHVDNLLDGGHYKYPDGGPYCYCGGHWYLKTVVKKKWLELTEGGVKDRVVLFAEYRLLNP